MISLMQHCLDAITIVAIGVTKEHKTEFFKFTTLIIVWLFVSH